TSSSMASRWRAPATSPPTARAVEPRGVLMIAVFAVRRLSLVLACLLALLATSQAQQPSNELQQLQASTRELYQSGDYAEAMQQAERALALVVREFGPEHEQAGIQTYSLGLISEKAGNLAAAERYFTQSIRIRDKVYGTEQASG